ncbi:GroES-like protein [Xylariaceae sp. FL0594]|nr:GroES-like protein [Xylariaceae sp. FL0594]
MAPTNRALVLNTVGAPLELTTLPYTRPGPNQLVVKNGAFAINSVDAGITMWGPSLFSYLRLPCVVGVDVAGEVVEVGSEVSRFLVGDRILAYAAGTIPCGNRVAEGGFQDFTVVHEHLAAPIPASLAYESACVLPLCFSTTAYGLFHHDFLALTLPSVPAVKPTTSRAVIITSGTSSVGSNAIQLAVAAGYEVYSTASRANFELVRGLGATAVFDYHDDACAADMVAALRGKEVVGAMSINPGGVAICADVLKNTNSTKMFIADAGPPPPTGYPESITSKFIDLLDVGEPEAVVGRLFRDFLPQALAAGSFRAAPRPEIVGSGLESVQKALDARSKGVFAVKPVITLS